MNGCPAPPVGLFHVSLSRARARAAISYDSTYIQDRAGTPPRPLYTRGNRSVGLFFFPSLINYFFNFVFVGGTNEHQTTLRSPISFAQSSLAYV